jgi:hypothetical protein
MATRWDVFVTTEYAAWFDGLPREHQRAIAVDLETLRSQGPQLGRPQVDHIKGSRHDNMKELRTSSGTSVYRSFFAFDPRRRGIILVGGDKAGRNQDRFYKSMTKQAEALYDRHLAQLNAKKEKS